MILLRIWSAAGVNGPVIFLEKGTKAHPKIRGNSLVTRYQLPEVSYVILNKAAYMYYETWVKVVKVVAPGIRKMKVRNVAFVLTIYSLSIHFSISIHPNSLQMIFIFQSDGNYSHMMVSCLT